MKSIITIILSLVIGAAGGYRIANQGQDAHEHDPETTTPMTFDIPETYDEPNDLGYVTVGGEKIPLAGSGQLQVGDTLITSTLYGASPYFDEEHPVELDDMQTTYKVIETVPSLDTPVCTLQTMQLEFAAKTFPDIQFVVLSNDTPFALERFCLDHNITNIQVLSDARTSDFARNNKLLMTDYNLFARSIMIVDQDNEVLYIDYADEVTEQVDILNMLAYLQSLTDQETGDDQAQYDLQNAG